MTLLWILQDGKEIPIKDEKPYGPNGPIMIGAYRSDHITSVEVIADMTVINESTRTIGNIETHGGATAINIPIGGGLSVGAASTQSNSIIETVSTTKQSRATEIFLKLKLLEGNEITAIVKSDSVYKWLIRESTKSPATDAALEAMRQESAAKALDAEAWSEAELQTPRPKMPSSTIWFGAVAFIASIPFYVINDSIIGYTITFVSWSLFTLFGDMVLTQPRRTILMAEREQAKKAKYEEIKRRKISEVDFTKRNTSHA